MLTSLKKMRAKGIAREERKGYATAIEQITVTE